MSGQAEQGRRASGSIEAHRAVVKAAQYQAGVVSRGQLRGIGWNAAMINGQLRSSRWVRMMHGIYLTNTGEPGVPAWWWAAHLFAGDSSAIAGKSALQLWRLEQPELPVRLDVPASRVVLVSDAPIVVTRRSRMRQVRAGDTLPPAVRIESALLDTCDELDDPMDVAALLSKACATRRTSVDMIKWAMKSHSRLRHRKFIEEVLAEVAGGAHSGLEVAGVRKVLRDHGLPTGTGQVREHQDGKTVFRDRVIEPYGLVIEFDGRLGHADPHSRLRDHRRDNAVVRSNRKHLRFGWADVHHHACECAAEIAGVLRSQGWLDAPTPCGPSCTVGQRLS